MAKILLSTVWHSGSNYVQRRLEEAGNEVEFLHCEPRVFKPKHIERFDRIVSTYRDPFQVGASWANRYDLYNDHEIQAHWYSLWACWSLLVEHYVDDLWLVEDFKGEPVRSEPDRSGAHAALKANDADKYEEVVPSYLIGYAISMTTSQGQCEPNLIRESKTH